MEGIITRQNKNGFYVIYIYPEADPYKRNNETWREKVFGGLSKEDIEREFYINFEAGLGKRIFDEFEVPVHTGEFSFIEGKDVYRGWDFGYNRPACVWLQKNIHDQYIILRELMLPKTYISNFADEVIRISTLEFPKATFRDFCDPSGVQKEGTSGRSMIDMLANDKQIFCSFKPSEPDRQYNIVHKLLRVRGDGKPGLMVDKYNCPILIEGFTGGFYARDRLTKGKLRAIDGSETNPSVDIMESMLYVFDNIEELSEKGYGSEEICELQYDSVTGIPLLN